MLNIKVNKDRVKITMGNPIYVISIDEYFDETLVDNKVIGAYLRKGEAEDYLVENEFKVDGMGELYFKNDEYSLINFIAKIEKLNIVGNNIIDLPI